MRDENEVLEMFEKHKEKCLQKRYREYLSVKPVNCIHNKKVRIKGVGKVGFCSCPAVLRDNKTKIFVCDTDEVANSCGHFECQNTPESVQDDFEEILGSPMRCGEEYPKLAVLIWVLMTGDISLSSRCKPVVCNWFKRLFSKGRKYG